MGLFVGVIVGFCLSVGFGVSDGFLVALGNDVETGLGVDDAVGDVAAEVLIVAQKMFGRGDDAVPLQSLDIGRGHGGGEQGVFAHILEIPSADR